VPDSPVTAVLDGQQRLTALNVGLRGSLAAKEPNKWWNNPNAFPVKRLHLDLLHEAKPDEEGEIYRFEFLTEERSVTPEVGDIASVGFKVENFDRKNMKKLEANWPKVAETLRLTVRLAASFGLSRDTLNADSALLTVAYYIHKKGVTDTYLTSKGDAEDRTVIKNWLIRSLIKPGIWGSALDVLLSALREVVRSDDNGRFPVAAIEHEMRVRGKNLAFTNEEIEDLADRRYGSRDLFGLLTLLFPFIDTRNQFHIDHIFPRTVFHANKLKALGLSVEEIARFQALKECLPNLQLLQGPDNQSKSGQMPAQWIANTYKKDEERKDYIARHLLDGVMTDLNGFEAFYKERRKRLFERIVEVLNQTAPAV